MRRFPCPLDSAWVLSAAIVFLVTLAGPFGLPAVASDCEPVSPDYFVVNLPKLGGVPAAENPEGWDLPAVWEGHPEATSDSITIPNNRPIYALIISGYAINAHFDELLVYDFARHIMAQGGYVHWAWWNNLLKPYLGGPLHYDQSHPGTAADLGSFGTPAAAANKAVPADDYQFIADAKLFLSAIRENNPEAIIVIVGHSMGGAACARLARQSEVVIDLVAPIDPVGNRNYPWAGPAQNGERYYNWTRWRASRGMFDGFRGEHFLIVGGCTAVDPLFENYSLALLNTDFSCSVAYDNAAAMTFQPNVINLWHRWQHEAAFPFDFGDVWQYGVNLPSGGSSTQASIAMQSSGAESGGWPAPNLGGDCCPIGVGVAWPGDGHGEIIGTRGPASAVRPLGTRVRTSPKCDGCPNTDWPLRTLVLGNWNDSNANITARMDRMIELEQLLCQEPLVCAMNPPSQPPTDTWPDRPYNPALCKVSPGLINRFNTMNKPPIADAGPDQIVECNGCTSAMVTLNGTGSSDPENGAITYTWTWNGGSATGPTPNVVLPYGPTCITLQVKDPAGHIKLDYTKATVRYASGVVPFPSHATLWKKSVGQFDAYAFDSSYPGVPNSTACLLPSPGKPATIQLDGGTLTASASEAGILYCAVQDASTTPAVSDAILNNNKSVLRFEFHPPVSAFYTYFGSLATGDAATMALYSDGGATLVDVITSPQSSTSSLASGFGFTSTAPIDRVEFTTTDEGATLIGAFVGLKTDEPSLGTIVLPGYQGPNGTNVELDFAVAFADLCPADFNSSGAVDVFDLFELLAAWGMHNGPADLNADGEVNVFDLFLLLTEWGDCP